MTEVVLSLGIFSGALSVVALVPMLLGQSKLSIQETKAALVTRQIINDLSSGSGPLRPLIDKEISASSQEALPLIALNESGLHVVYYTADGSPVSATSPEASLKAEVSVAPPEATHPGLSQVAIRISGVDESTSVRPIVFYTKVAEMKTATAPTSSPPVASAP